MSTNNANVWGVFVGKGGSFLEAFNSFKGPFPPEPNTQGYIAIRWPAIGDMRLYKDDYPDFIDKFRLAYAKDDERTFKTVANEVWNFAYMIKSGDWVISPSSASGFLLVGKIQGDYTPNFEDGHGLPKIKGGSAFVHLREVKWLHAISADDPRYSKLNKIGAMTVVQPKFSSADLQTILKSQD
tara:strand:- start:583 stop:1131 length:549 start_codon:yes stop_codon:yes gene_type:complete